MKYRFVFFRYSGWTLQSRNGDIVVVGVVAAVVVVVGVVAVAVVVVVGVLFVIVIDVEP